MHLPATIPLVYSRSAVLSAMLALAMLSSSVVFSEPAPVDALMMAFVAALAILGLASIGPAIALNAFCWLGIVALGFFATMFSPEFGSALKHQAVTLFLAVGALAIAAFVAGDPERRGSLVLNWYVAGIVIATVLAYIGYFKLLPGAYDLFTNYGRARGSYKDPNVYGAALGPAITYLAWLVLRRPASEARLPALLCLFLAPALLISFSRGAWISVAISIAVLGLIAFTRTRRQSDRTRFVFLTVAGCAALLMTLMAALQVPAVSDLLRERASLTHGYDVGPEGRFGGQQKGVRLMLENPLGIGTHTFREVHHHEEVHNVYLTTFHNAGWIGGLLYIISMFATLWLGVAGALRIDARQGLFAVATAAFIGLLVEGLVIDSDHWRHFFIVLGLIWGLSDAPSGRVAARR